MLFTRFTSASGFVRYLGKALLELVYTTGSVDKLFFTGVVGVAL